MGRGIDFKGVNLVLNYDFPQSAISYIHRIGRTGRAGRQGRAITFFTEDDAVSLRRYTDRILEYCLASYPAVPMFFASSCKRKKLGRLGTRLNINFFHNHCFGECPKFLACSCSIANVMQSSGCEVPEWMLQLRKPSK